MDLQQQQQQQQPPQHHRLLGLLLVTEMQHSTDERLGRGGSLESRLFECVVRCRARQQLVCVPEVLRCAPVAR